MIGITHSDLDGLVSAMLAGIHFGFEPEDVRFARPSDAQHGIIDIIGQEIVVTDLPYISGATYWFDHHLSNFLDKFEGILGVRETADSCAGILARVFEVPGYGALVSETDRIDSLDLTPEEIFEPYGYYLLSKLINEDFSEVNTVQFNHYLMSLMKDKGDHIGEIIADPLVEDKITEYFRMQELARPYLKQQMQSSNGLLLVDLRGAPSKIYTRCSFMYDPFVFDGGKDSGVMVRTYHPGLDHRETRFQVVKNPLIVDNSPNLDIGAFLNTLGGGGHPYSGGVTIDTGETDRVYEAIMGELRR